MNALRQYVPNANSKDWILETAGKRVQVIKKDENGEGILEFGTEVITSADGTIAGLLGASPGASTATSIMLDLVEKCFKGDVPGWKDKLKEMIPSYKQSLNDNKDLCKSVREKTSTSLKIK
jgi:malate dehydrogenase (quinone)